MSTPNEDTFAAEVESVVSQLKPNAEGKLELPDGVEASSNAIYAAKIEMRRRDTFASFSQVKTENKALEAQNSALATQWEKDAGSMLTATQNAELAELKASDPDAWLAKIDEHRGTNATAFTKKKEEVIAGASKMTALELRTAQIEQYNADNPEFVINDEVIAEDVPPRFTKQLEKGDITFEEFIEKTSKFLKAGKVLDPGTTKEKEPNLSDNGGSSKPEDRAIVASDSETYKKTVF